MAGAIQMVVDTETTGLDPRLDGIVQVGLAYRDPSSGSVQTWGEICHPGEAHLAGTRWVEAFRINGMTIEKVKAARPSVDVAKTLRATLLDISARHGSIQLHAFNVEFDRAFLRNPPWQLTSAWGPCIMRLAHQKLNPTGRWPTLHAACSRLGVPAVGDRAHDAMQDAHAALLVLERLTMGERDFSR